MVWIRHDGFPPILILACSQFVRARLRRLCCAKAGYALCVLCWICCAQIACFIRLANVDRLRFFNNSEVLGRENPNQMRRKPFWNIISAKAENDFHWERCNWEAQALSWLSRCALAADSAGSVPFTWRSGAFAFLPIMNSFPFLVTGF